MPFNIFEDPTMRSLSTLGITWSHTNFFQNNNVQTTYIVSTSTTDQFNKVIQKQSQPLNTMAYTLQNLTPGRLYSISVTATDICGTSDPAQAQLTAGTCPDQPLNVETRRMLNGLDQVQCTWTTPNNNGFAITHYTVEIRTQNLNNEFIDQYVNAAAYCNENQNNADTIFGNQCTINEATLRTMPFNLPEQAEVMC